MSSNDHKSWFDRLAFHLSREPQDQEQLLSVLKDAQSRELIDEEGLHMIEGILEFSEMQVRDVMIPRSQMVVIAASITVKEALPLVVESKHSRFPIVGDNRDEVLGVLLAKDLLPYAFNKKSDTTRIREIARPAIFIPESKRLDILLKEFRSNRNHMAIVADEYGGVSGLVTIEDVLEQIVGDINDEYDSSENTPNIKVVDEAEFSVKALTPVEEFNTFFATKFSDEEYDTIGGYVMRELGHLPETGEHLSLGELYFEVSNADRRRIITFTVKILNQAPADNSSEKEPNPSSESKPDEKSKSHEE